MINQYINQPTSLSHISLIAFVANYDIKTLKKYKKSNVAHSVGFNKHKDLENHYRKLLLLFSPFIMSEVSQKKHIQLGIMLIKQRNFPFKQFKINS
jgi:hypothetical protein